MSNNQEEWFDVVNEHDEVVGRESRREVHARGLRHRAVHLLVVNRAGKVFLQKRSMAKDLHPGVWDSSASGHVGAGEDYDGTAVRELEEEIGLKLPEGSEVPPSPHSTSAGLRRTGAAPRPQIRPLFKIEAREETGQEFVWVYRVEAEGPFTLHPDEIERGDWFSPAEIDRWAAERPQELAPAFLYLWPKARGMR